MARELKALARDRPRPVRPAVRCARALAIALALTALAFAVQYGEDGQVGGNRAVSAGMFFLAGCAACHALAVAAFAWLGGRGGSSSADKPPREGDAS